jgi:hypothetical protein
MRLSTSVVAAALVTTLSVGFARPSFAQYNQYPGGPQPNPAPPPSQAAPNGEYVAPLSQQTQQVYVPQSVALSGPRMIKDWQEGEPIPPGYHRTTRVRTGLVVGGALTFGIPYLYSGLIASAGADIGDVNNTSNSLAALYVPVLGPFIEMGQTNSATARYFLALDGLAQGAGLFMLIYAIASPRNILVRNDLAMLTVTPVKMGHDGQGLGVFGRF